MKKLLLFAAAWVMCLGAAAQSNQVVWQNGRVMYGAPIESVDSILYNMDNVLEGDTLHLILPRTIVQVVRDTVVKTETVVEKETVYVHDTVYQNQVKPLNGLFSVSASKQVQFAPGNLQYTYSTNTWAFAAQQYEILGTANFSNGTPGNTVDVFGWSGSTGSNKWGIIPSGTAEHHTGDFVDWGQNIGDGTTWRTLTKDEWDYLLHTRTNASALMGVACINLTANGSQYVNGLILLPDNWKNLITIKSGFVSTSATIFAYGKYQTLSLEDWSILEALGAVFLPAAGWSGSYSMQNVNLYGEYQTATPDDASYAIFIRISPNNAISGSSLRTYHHSVRLVMEQ